MCVCVHEGETGIECQGANGQIVGIIILATGITGISHTKEHTDTHMHIIESINITEVCWPTS